MKKIDGFIQLYNFVFEPVTGYLWQYKDLNFIVHRMKNSTMWQVTELRSGIALPTGGGETRKDVISTAKNCVDVYDAERLNEFIENNLRTHKTIYDNNEYKTDFDSSVDKQ